ncbi:UbiA family prenyltransferase [Nonomuraea sp. NPDC005692]|uniref:UbiA family prenyltransferase n=1 Tax=Nonomuraea sp. NPDC005692 TaxID=3157168 RepID=UPI003405AEBF
MAETPALQQRGASGLSPRRWARREVVLAWRCNVTDLTAAVIPGVLASAAAWRAHALPLTELPWVLAKALVYFWLFLCVHTLSNQASGVAEDQVNKPWRPIPAGLMTARGAWVRWRVAVAAFLLAGALMGILTWTVLWLAMVGLRTYRGLMRHWYVKNPAIVVGAWALLAAGWQIAGPLTPRAWPWVAAGTAYWLVGFVEDLRDVPGDRRCGRRTLPMAMGQWPVRLVAACALTALPVAAVGLTRDVTAAGWWTWAVVLAGGCWWVALRLTVLRTARQDAATYQLYCLTWCWLVSGPLVLG